MVHAYNNENYEWSTMDGAIHRDDGPAIQFRGNVTWCNHGKLHRTDGGPAIMMQKCHNLWCDEFTLLNGLRDLVPNYDACDFLYIWAINGRIRHTGDHDAIFTNIPKAHIV